MAMLSHPANKIYTYLRKVCRHLFYVLYAMTLNRNRLLHFTLAVTFEIGEKCYKLRLFSLDHSLGTPVTLSGGASTTGLR